MEDFEKRIEEFEKNYVKIKEARYKEFSELETEFCKVINEGTALRNYLKDNPELCDENTYRVLLNQLTDMSLIEDRYKFLEHVLDLKRILLKHYNDYVGFLVKNKNFNMAIRIYNQMYAFTGNPFYKKEIANIHLKIFNDYKKCFEIYKEIEPQMEKSPHFWWEFSEVYAIGKDYFNRIMCMQKAVKLEKEQMNK